MYLWSLFLVLLVLRSYVLCQVEEFISIDCEGTINYTDKRTELSWISKSGMMKHGNSVEVQNPGGNKNLSRRNLKGEIPRDLNNMESLTELWLGGNLLTEQLPDMSNLVNLKIVEVRSLIREGDVISIMDPSLVGNVKTESVWRVAEIAMQCVVIIFRIFKATVFT
ncbi:hypothetical protein VNO80_04997 [Phaseolus coccineus]|uniref:Uncharacterized protein n=1 Tax=Phaseolus coccineus TaxID=3886 RepID=A0AAN9RP46_PHACN